VNAGAGPPACRSCGAIALAPVLDLGQMPLANALVDPEGPGECPERRFPLEVAFCPSCTLVQILHSVPPADLFHDYPYFSSWSTTMVDHARALVERLVTDRELGAHSRVVEVASNDGYLLRWYVARGVPALGIEPAANVAAVARAQGIPTEAVFFDEGVARRLVETGGHADVVHANNVLAHVPDPNGFVAGLRVLIGPRGIAVIEVPYVRPLIEYALFDTIYHEHLFYFSLTSVARLLERNGLALADVERLTIHGGSLRLTVRARGDAADGKAKECPAAAALLAEEHALGMTEHAFYAGLRSRVETVRDRLRDLLNGLRADGHALAGYGAAAKGAVLLNAFGIGRETLDFVVDRSPHKRGKRMPGVGLPISAPERLLADMPAFTLLLTWNFADEILAQQVEYRRRGGRFILPFPEPRVLA
jgi:SAM-dependent methyltransferase